MTSFEMEPIGWVRGGRTVVEDDDWGSVTSRIDLDPDQFNAVGLGIRAGARSGRSWGSSLSARRIDRTESARPCAILSGPSAR